MNVASIEGLLLGCEHICRVLILFPISKVSLITFFVPPLIHSMSCISEFCAAGLSVDVRDEWLCYAWVNAFIWTKSNEICPQEVRYVPLHVFCVLLLLRLWFLPGISIVVTLVLRSELQVDGSLCIICRPAFTLCITSLECSWLCCLYSRSKRLIPVDF